MPGSRPQLRRALFTAPLLLALALALAWYDVLPGGWRLRGWVQPHEQARAREQARYSAQRVALFAAENGQVAAGAVVFLGSSTIERFPLEELFPAALCLDRGIGSETATELLARLDASLPSAPPAAAVLYVGSMDFRHLGRPPRRVADLAAAVITDLRRRFADLPIALVGILPEREMPPEMTERLAATNAALAELCAATGCAFVPTDRPPISAAGGSLAPECAADDLHLNDAGYRALARWLVEEGGRTGELLAGE